MQVFSRPSKDDVIILLISIILVLMLILITDIHIARIDRDLHQTTRQSP